MSLVLALLNFVCFVHVSFIFILVPDVVLILYSFNL